MIKTFLQKSLSFWGMIFGRLFCPGFFFQRFHQKLLFVLHMAPPSRFANLLFSSRNLNFPEADFALHRAVGGCHSRIQKRCHTKSVQQNKNAQTVIRERKPRLRSPRHKECFLRKALINIIDFRFAFTCTFDLWYWFSSRPSKSVIPGAIDTKKCRYF